jgi:hypothetical protein
MPNPAFVCVLSTRLQKTPESGFPFTSAPDAALSPMNSADMHAIHHRQPLHKSSGSYVSFCIRLAIPAPLRQSPTEMSARESNESRGSRSFGADIWGTRYSARWAGLFPFAPLARQVSASLRFKISE